MECSAALASGNTFNLASFSDSDGEKKSYASELKLMVRKELAHA